MGSPIVLNLSSKPFIRVKMIRVLCFSLCLFRIVSCMSIRRRISVTIFANHFFFAMRLGTLWCGDGNYARNVNEIGLFRNTDICCKHHDQCPAFIRPGNELKGLRNTGLFTRSHCDCDQKFYTCLKNIDSIISNKIGITYFNILKPKCFRREYPIAGCRKW